MPKVSVITPVWIDTPQKLIWLREAIVSVVSQSFVDWEMIIVDDSSPLAPDPVISEFENEPRIRWFKASKRQGPAMCRNTAVALAKSDAIYALDADDRLTVNALEDLYPVWERNPSRVVYGDLQRLELRNGAWISGKVASLPEYTFERALDLGGIMPVSAMHSVECHQKSGGWKPQFDAGLEDVEYWISAGKAGFCGYHINALVLEYRRHEQSRAYAMQRVDRRTSEMRKAIQAYHADVYRDRRYPMGCCGGGGSKSPSTASATAQTQARPTTLDQYSASEKVWVEYTGKRQASFGVVGQFTGISYQIFGMGFTFEAHVSDTPRLKRLGRGRDFVVGVPAPAGVVSEPVQSDVANESYNPPAPEMAEIVTLDETKADMGQPVTLGMEPEPPPEVEYPLTVLGLGEVLESRISDAGFTIRNLANTDPDTLQGIRGIGPARAKKIIQEAQNYAVAI